MKSNWRLGLPLALTTAVFWGTVPIALSVVLKDMDPYTVTWYRFVIAAALLLPILVMSGRLPRLGSLGARPWLLVVFAIAGISGNYVLFLLGLHFTSPTVTQVVSQLGPLFLMLAGVTILRESLLGPQRWGIVVLIAGLLLFFNRRLPGRWVAHRRRSKEKWKGRSGAFSFLVNSNHYIGGFDHSVGILSLFETEAFYRRVCDDGNDLGAACNFDCHFRIDCSFDDLCHFAFDDISCAELHGVSPYLIYTAICSPL